MKANIVPAIAGLIITCIIANILINKGEKVQDIADKLSLSSKTVNSYRYRMFEKLNIGGDVELTHLAIRHGLLDMDKL